MSSEEAAAYKEALLEGPALEPPPGVAPNFENPGGSHTLGYSIPILGGVLSCLAVLLRLRCRSLVKSIRLEDGLFIVALGLFAGQLYIIYDSTIFPGMDVHQWNVQLKTLIHILFTAILLDWLHIFVPLGQRNYMFWICHAMIWSNVIFYAVGTIVGLFQCIPREKVWNPLFEGGSCPINMHAHNRASGIINLVSDFCILALPQKVIWNMNMSRSKRLSVSVLFAIGILACVCATARLVYFNRFIEATDVTYASKDLALWSVGETMAGFLIMGAPSAPKAFQSLPFSECVIHLLRSFTRTSASSNYRDGLPSWRKPPTRRRRGPWDITELETSDMVSLKSTTGAEDARPSTVTRDVSLEQEVSRDTAASRTVQIT
ncbi:hypothetical protein DL770_010594 [Monosporascus sp. CRB-9-2]|nr:hypothetical protein DL770_010594 [Monosporascus sp. CRB-9-2]